MDAADVPIAANQVLYDPYFHRVRMLPFYRDHDMLPTAYSPLAPGSVADNKVLTGDR